MSPTLPERPDLGRLKKQAKSLLRAARARDRAALERFLVLPAFAGSSSTALESSELALHDAQSVIAREHGFASWNALREEIETRTLTFDAAVEEFVRCATGGAADRAERLLALYPAIATATLETALVLGDAAAFDGHVRARPIRTTEPIGVRRWQPLLYVCHTCLHRHTPVRAAGLVAIARSLCALGADPNAEYHWDWHPELPRTALWGALCEVRHLPLADALLEAGASPTDGVSAHIAAGIGDLAALERLDRFGLDANGIAGGVPPLVYSMLWTENPAGPIWLLEHGADPNLAWGEAGEAPLHVAARRWDVPMVERLVSLGADPLRRRADGRTAHTLAALHGNGPVAAWLAARGVPDELTPLERFVAACARGDRASAASLLVAQPRLPAQLTSEHHLLLQRPAEGGDAAVLEAMLGCGFDPNRKDAEGVTALHRAAIAGQVDATRVLLRFGADVAALDGMFAAPPLVWAVEGRRRAAPGSDHVGVARLLIAAGSPLEWTPPAGAPSPEATLDGLAALRAAALAV